MTTRKSDMVPDPGTRVRLRREARGLTQVELARASGLSRQSIGSIEASRSVPAVDVALRIARALEQSVEELFGEAKGAERLDVETHALRGDRVVLAHAGDRWVAHAAPTDGRTSADAIVVSRGRGRAVVEPTRAIEDVRANLLVLGCAMGLGLVADRASRSAGLGRAVWLAASSGVSLEALAERRAHVAAVHFGEQRVPTAQLADVRRASRAPTTLVRFATWEAGLVVTEGNPRRLRTAADLGRRDLRVVTREHGSGARRLLDRELAKHGVSLVAPIVADGHREVASLVATGAADVGIATRDVALARGLGFVALAEERVDLLVPTASLEDPRIVRLLDTLTAVATRRELGALGYDTRESGAQLGEVAA